MKKALVCGAGGFIGGHLVRCLKDRGYRVRGVDRKEHEYARTAADEFLLADLRDPRVCEDITDQCFDEIYQLAADMGGAGYIFTGEHDADVMRNSAMINLNMLDRARVSGAGKIFFSSSACVYPAHNQEHADAPECSEDSVYPAAPDSEYGWEKLFSERLYLACNRNYGMQVRIARFHNIFGPLCAWQGGREKAPAAICRKIASEPDGGTIEIWGDGRQTRSFLYIDECLEGVRRLMDSDFPGPVNIGSTEMVTIDQLANVVAEIAGKRIRLRHVPGPLGVRGRTSDNRLIRNTLGWAPPENGLRCGLEITYAWVDGQVRAASGPAGPGTLRHA